MSWIKNLVKICLKGTKETEICQKLPKKAAKMDKKGPEGVKNFWLMVWHDSLKSDVNRVKHDKKVKGG